MHYAIQSVGKFKCLDMGLLSASYQVMSELFIFLDIMM